jgi:hypothetical protein
MFSKLFRKGVAFLACLLATCYPSPPAAASEPNHSHLHLRKALGPEQRDRLSSAFAGIIREVLVLVEANGYRCRSFLHEDPKGLFLDLAEPGPDGVSLSWLPISLKCSIERSDAGADDQHSPYFHISIHPGNHTDRPSQEDLEKASALAIQPGRAPDQYTLSIGRASTSGTSISIGEVTVPPAISVSFRNFKLSQVESIAKQLPVRRLVQLASELRPLPLAQPLPPEVPKELSRRQRQLEETLIIEAAFIHALRECSGSLLVEDAPARPAEPLVYDDGYRLLAPDLRPSLFEDWNRQLDRRGIPALPKIASPISKETLARSLTDDAWPRFRAEHRGLCAALAISHVGFSADGTQALVYAVFKGGSMSIEWAFVLFKAGGKWAPAYEFMYDVQDAHKE